MIEFTSCTGSWVMRIDNGKILFNREKWPEAKPDDFATAVIRLIEKAEVKMSNWNNLKMTEKNVKRK